MQAGSELSGKLGDALMAMHSSMRHQKAMTLGGMRAKQNDGVCDYQPRITNHIHKDPSRLAIGVDDGYVGVHPQRT